MREGEFVPLAEFLNGRCGEDPASCERLRDVDITASRTAVNVASAAMHGEEIDELDQAARMSRERGHAVRDARVFRARLLDAFDEAVGRLLGELAADVLARELLLAPCDLAQIARRVARAAPIVCVRISSDAAASIDGFVTVHDETLATGDAVIEIVGGAIDARLGVRLADVLDACR